MRKIVFIDGVDGVGKTTICKEIVEIVESVFKSQNINESVMFHRQPSNTGTLGEIREVVKYKEGVSFVPRQLLHVASHIQDLYEVFDTVSSNGVCICDRSILSTAVYAHSAGVPLSMIDKIMAPQLEAYREFFKDWDVLTVLKLHSPFREESDGSIYESEMYEKEDKKKSYQFFIERYSNPENSRKFINSDGKIYLSIKEEEKYGNSLKQKICEEIMSKM